MVWPWLAWGAMAGGVGVFGWVWEKAGEKGRKWLEWGLFLAVAMVSASSVALHEPWRDELHTWFQAREMGPGALWKEMACEGHFLPWYLLLWPLAHSGAPVWTMGAVSWALNALAVGWLARRSPLSGWEKAAAGVSCLFLYVNPVISRCYVLIPPALWGMASLWGKRDERPVAFGLWVALLANTHLYMEGMAVALFAVYAWENVPGRRDGRNWRKCGRQWTGLGVMAAGGALALAQVLPSLWKSAVMPGHAPAFRESTAWFFQACVSRWGEIATATGLAVLGVGTWRKDRGAFLVCAAGLVYMWLFSVFLYEADVLNRSLLWWPVAVSAAWIAAGEGTGGRWWRVLAVVAAGVSIARPDLTLKDWLMEYDSLPGACRWIEDRYGKDAEVWINGKDFALEPAAVYLDKAMDWRTGKNLEPITWALEKAGEEPSRAWERAFGAFPEKESLLVLISTWEFCGLKPEDFRRSGLEIEKKWERVMGPGSVELALLRVPRWGGEWGAFGIARYRKGDREGAVAAWKRAVEEERGQWEAMNNLARVAVEDGHVAEARKWIDRAMEHEAARRNAGTWDTEAAVRRAEGDEAGAREAERRRAGVGETECSKHNAE